MCLVSHYARLDTSENHLTGSIFCCFFSFFVVAITLITAHRIFSAICIRHRVASALLCVFRLSSVCDAARVDRGTSGTSERLTIRPFGSFFTKPLGGAMLLTCVAAPS
jgi:hypothetical protein